MGTTGQGTTPTTPADSSQAAMVLQQISDAASIASAPLSAISPVAGEVIEAVASALSLAAKLAKNGFHVPSAITQIIAATADLQATETEWSARIAAKFPK